MFKTIDRFRLRYVVFLGHNINGKSGENRDLMTADRDWRYDESRVERLSYDGTVPTPPFRHPSKERTVIAGYR